MYKHMAVFTETVTNPKALILNPLRTLNAQFKLIKDAKAHIADGTPITPSAVDKAVSQQFGIEFTNDTHTTIFKTMTYAPAGPSGAPCDDKIKATLPDLAGLPICLHAGDRTSDQLNAFGYQAVLGKAAPQSVDLEDVLKGFSFETPRQLTLTENQFKALSKTEKETVLQFLNQMPHLLRLTLEVGALSLAMDVFGNSKIQEQVAFAQGYVGPVSAPLAQLLYGADISVRTAAETPDPKPAFVDFFNSHTGLTIQNEASFLVSGGCSGALFQVLMGLPDTGKQVFIPAPFFVPVEGIVKAAEHSPVIQKGYGSLIESLRTQASPGDKVLLTFPNNPDGKIPSLSEIKEIIKLANKKGEELHLIVDCTYFNMVRDKSSYHALMAELQQAKNCVLIASGSKALGLTKYRSALVTCSPALTPIFSKEGILTPIDVVAATALYTSLSDPNIRDSVATEILKNVQENSILIPLLLEPGYQPSLGLKWNPSLQALREIVLTLDRELPGNKLRFIPGDGALYATLEIPHPLQTRFRELAKEKGLLLTPGELFSGIPNKSIAAIVDSNQATYRLALMTPVAS